MPHRILHAGLSKVPRLPVTRCVTLLGGVLGSTGAELVGHQVIAIGALLVTAAIIALELWIGKRRDDVFRAVAMRDQADPDVLRAISVHEAVRSGQLASADTARMLQSAETTPKPAAETPEEE